VTKNFSRGRGLDAAAYGREAPGFSPGRFTRENWEHDDGADRVEHVAAHNPDLAGRIGRIALRFISEKGLSGEFPDVLQEIERVEAARSSAPAEDAPTP
jgi:hypothetical protein